MGENLVAAVVLTVAAAYLTWTATRIDRLHERVDAADRSLTRALLRRHDVARSVAGRFPDGAAVTITTAITIAIDAAENAAPDDQEAAENALSAVLRRAADDPARPALADLIDAGAGLGLARQFHNDAVRDTRAVRWRPTARLFSLGGDRPIPDYFDIDPGTPSLGRASTDPDPAAGNTVVTDNNPPQEGR